MSGPHCSELGQVCWARILPSLGLTPSCASVKRPLQESHVSSFGLNTFFSNLWVCGFIGSITYSWCFSKKSAFFVSVPGCGFLFDDFVNRYASYSTHRTIRKVISKQNQGVHCAVDERIRATIIDAEKIAFRNYLVLMLNHMMQKAVLDIMWLFNLCLRRKGLSKTGMELVSDWGFGIGPRKYYEKLHAEVKLVGNTARSVVAIVVIFTTAFAQSLPWKPTHFLFGSAIAASRPHAVWVDNFFRIFRWNIPTAQSSIRTDKCFTVSGIVTTPELLGNPTPNRAVDLSFSREFISATPSDLFSEARINEFTRFYVDSEKKVRASTSHEGSVSKDIRRIPLRLDAQNLQREQKFNPRAIEDIDIGSNRGFLDVMKTIEAENKDAKKYIPILCDVNIYKRILKVGFCCSLFSHLHAHQLACHVVSLVNTHFSFLFSFFTIRTSQPLK